jgi:hypothetical protein
LPYDEAALQEALDAVPNGREIFDRDFRQQVMVNSWQRELSELEGVEQAGLTEIDDQLAALDRREADLVRQRSEVENSRGALRRRRRELLQAGSRTVSLRKDIAAMAKNGIFPSEGL